MPPVVQHPQDQARFPLSESHRIAICPAISAKAIETPLCEDFSGQGRARQSRAGQSKAGRGVAGLSGAWRGVAGKSIAFTNSTPERLDSLSAGASRERGSELFTAVPSPPGAARALLAGSSVSSVSRQNGNTLNYKRIHE